MTVDDFWEKLEAIGWLKYVPREKHEEIRKGLGPNVTPEYALPSVWIFSEKLVDILNEMAAASFGIFAPTDIEENINKSLESAEISFKQGEKLFSCEAPYTIDYFKSVLDLVNESLAACQADCRFLPLPSDEGWNLAFIPPAIYQKAVKAKLIPKGETWYLDHLLAREKGKVSFESGIEKKFAGQVKK